MFDDPLIRRLIKQTVIWLTVLGAILFLVAGTFDWPGAWVLLIESGVLGVLSGVRIARHDPELLQERMRGPIQKEQKPWDKRLLAIIFSLCFLMPIVAGLEVRSARRRCRCRCRCWARSRLAFGIYVFHVVMETNSYASAVVRIQSERGQKVISTGPYAYVRHPMYGGAIAYFLGLGLLLGSWYAVGIGIVIIALFGLRAVWEEETLARELDGYAAYAAARPLPVDPGRLVGAHSAPPCRTRTIPSICSVSSMRRRRSTTACSRSCARDASARTGCGSSFRRSPDWARAPMAQRYAIASRAEAAAYLAHPVLGPRLRECARLVTATEGRSIHDIFGSPDDMKFHSSMTLFAEASPGDADFRAALEKYFGGAPDPATLAHL